jgi:diadenosine tetraphosphate (Ap4A) HIT family hydrolase
MLCDRVTGPAQPEGGWILRGQRWAVSSHPLLPVPGWILIQTVRHVESLADLDEPEAQELGGVLRRTYRALQAVTGHDRVYSLSMGEQVRHVHILAGVPREDDAGRGARLMIRLLNRDPSLAEAERSHAMSAELAAALAADVGTVTPAR